ncbi:MAG: hypothetical protein Fur0034_01620 [Desulfuromonadia bacterium]
MGQLTILLLIALCSVASALAGPPHDVRGWNPQTDAVDVLDRKCQTCHSRQRIDSAVEAKKDMQEVISRMEKKGVRLSDKEREVLGIFWKGPFKGEKK